MIIMINGPFGVGKTSLAETLEKRIDNSMLFDPEEIGFFLRKITKNKLTEEEDTGDFQDITIWKSLTVDVAQYLVDQYGKHLVVPMTIHNKVYFNYIYSGFAKVTNCLIHFCLLASHETIHNRLKKRGDIIGSWPYHQTESCLSSYEDNIFPNKIYTDTKSVDQIADSILDHIRCNSNSKILCKR
jgi:broad-specificity NMP kinase